MRGESSSIDFSVDLPKFFELFKDDDRLFLRLEDIRLEFGLVAFEVVEPLLVVLLLLEVLLEVLGAPDATIPAAAAADEAVCVLEVNDDEISSTDGDESCLLFSRTSNLRVCTSCSK